MNRTLVQPKWIWPSVIAFSAMLAGTLSLANSSVWLRPLAGLWFLLVCPGMAFVGLLPVREQGTRWTLAVALSLALDALVASFLIYANHWSPNTALVILIAASLFGASLQVFTVRIPAEKWFQRAKNGGALPSVVNGTPGVQHILPIPGIEENSTTLADTKETILLVNKDAVFSAILEKHLQASGYRIVSSHAIEEAARTISKAKPRLILVDYGVIGANGWADLQRLRKKSTSPILIQGENLAEGDLVQGFQFGADDYVTKSISLAKLADRIAVLNSQPRQIHTVNGIVRSKGLTFDLIRKRVTTGGQTAELTKKEYRLLAILVSNVNRTIPLSSLGAEVNNLNAKVSIRSIRRIIRSLRTKIEADPGRPRYIITRRGYGYRFEVSDR